MRKLLTTAALVMFGLQAPLADAQNNVVLFMVDDMGWTDWQYDATLNPTGSTLYETPNMLRLAQMGTNFTQAYSANAVCSPSRAAVMTGKDPARIRITDWITGGNWTHPTLADTPNFDTTLNDSEVTLAEAVKANGYDTAFLGKWHLGASGTTAADPTNHGFDVNIGGNHNGSPLGGYFAKNGGWNAPGINSGYADGTYLTDALSDAAVGYIDGRNTPGSGSEDTDPFFMFMSHYAVHTPIQAPAATVQYFQGKLNAGGDFGEHDNAYYAAIVKHVDDALGALIDELEDEGLLASTSIILASDNGGLWAAQGDPTSNAPLRAGKGSFYGGGIRTPLLVANPGSQAGVSNDTVVIGHDIYNTVLELTGTAGDAAHNALTDGASFAQALNGTTLDRGAVFWHYPHISDQDHGSSLVTGGTFVSAVRKGDWKLIYFYEDERYELYNLAEDIGETTDVFVENAITNELSTLLRDHLIEIDAQMPVYVATGQEVALPSVVVPEPSSLLLLGVSGLIMTRRRRRQLMV